MNLNKAKVAVIGLGYVVFPQGDNGRSGSYLKDTMHISVGVSEAGFRF